ncbi:hypothetical protein [Pseudomonas aeruginosa]|uniref:hypothetical protein n=1 Tax=Pseudomonas aeruginosa TaxID=287 RepID=UPI000F7F6BCD|nr:hypothetical protein [Pseudomonas aeruginosa]RTC40981.1 hypothetical protein EKL37_17015 [Pseudomonas aeruginosa]HDR3117502.1 hypothetical protein [Pseudomonas aeruginosa]
MSIHLRFLAAIDRLQRLDTPVLAATLDRDWLQFRQRGWITEEGYLTHVMVPFLDSECEVEVETDPDAGCYRYRSPQNGRTVVQPLRDIALCGIQIDPWLSDLASLIGIEDRQRSHRPCRTPNHLWHLGELRIVGTHDFAPVFIGRSWKRAPNADISAVLADPAWPRGGVVLLAQRFDAVLPRDHAFRGLNEFIHTSNGMESFDVDALDRVLRGYVTADGEPEPLQFFQGDRLKLPHFDRSRELSAERAKIIKQMWGVEGKPSPEMSWAEANRIPNTGYQSFDDAFGGKAEREDVIAKVSRGKYRVRRNP